MLFTALHRLLGSAPGPITDEMIDTAVAAQLAESDDLDWKSKLIAVKDLPLSDYPKDVAAMANRGGGLLVYGIKETEKRATERVDVGAFDERYEAALLSAAVTAINPPVFNLNVTWVGEPGNQVVAVVIPATTDAPHLIYRNDYFGAPIRNDAMTVWMRERELESLYRARFDERRRSTEGLDGLYDEAAVNFPTDGYAQFVAVAHPRVPSTLGTRPTKDNALGLYGHAEKSTVSWSGNMGFHPMIALDRWNPRAGYRRWVYPNGGADSQSAWVAVHHDGSVTLASAVGGQRTREGELAGNLIDCGDVEAAVSDFMAFVLAQATLHGTQEYDVRVGIEWEGDPLLMYTSNQFGHRYQDGSIPITRFRPVVTTVTTSAAPSEYHWQVHDLAEDCINQGGLTVLQRINPPSRDES